MRPLESSMTPSWAEFGDVNPKGRLGPEILSEEIVVSGDPVETSGDLIGIEEGGSQPEDAGNSVET